MISSTRILSFERIDNFRDFGGYSSRYGGRVAAGRLFRSAHYASATPADLRKLTSLKLRLITDLRRPTERALHPVPLLPELSARIIDNDLGDQSESPHIAFLRQPDLSDASIHAYLINYYTSAPLELRYANLFSRYFRALATLEGAAWVHCVAGKDRTGILVALTHDLLGVNEDDLAADFLLTNQLMQVEERLAEFAPKLEKLIGRPPTDAAIRGFLGVSWDHLHAMLSVLRQQYGSVEGYATRVLGLDATTLQQIRLRLLERQS
jgi:protein tyrosine/serine phosphatase